jgi:hypothetical protein
VVAPIKETAVSVVKTAQSAATLAVDPSLSNAAALGKNLASVAVGEGTVDGIITGVKTGDWVAVALNATVLFICCPKKYT